jgi:hypothetical protein
MYDVLLPRRLTLIKSSWVISRQFVKTTDVSGTITMRALMMGTQTVPETLVVLKN